MKYISSVKNPRIKLARALERRKIREREGLFLVEGIRQVGEALAAGADIAYLCYAPGQLTSEFGQGLVEQAASAGVQCYATSDEVFVAVSGREGPQGILAVVHQRWTDLEDLDPEKLPWGVVLSSPQDPGNLGAVLRTLDAAGASGLVLLDGGVDPFHPTAVRASMGALFWHPVAAATTPQFSDWVRQRPYQVYGTSARGEADYRAVHYASPAILLMGSEREGLTPAQVGLCTREVRLPMRGHVTSLNLAVATGVMLYTMAEHLNMKA